MRLFLRELFVNELVAVMEMLMLSAKTMTSASSLAATNSAVITAKTCHDQDLD